MLENTFLRRLSVLALCLALAGCCANDVCNCKDELADALFFRFNYTRKRQYATINGQLVPTSFNAKDIDTIRIYRRNIRPATLRDTIGFVRQTDSITVVRQLDTRTSPGDTLIAVNVLSTSANGTTTTLPDQDIIVINNASPFASSSTTKLNAYTYRIGVVRGRRKPRPIYYITGIELNGRYNANGCCTCYENTKKTDTLTTGSTREYINAADSVDKRRIARLRFQR